MAVRFGRISKTMMRQVDSPVARAASTKSRRRSDRVCARSTRAPHAHEVQPMTSAMVQSPEFGITLVMMMMSGSAGMTMNTLDSADSPSAAAPER